MYNDRRIEKEGEKKKKTRNPRLEPSRTSITSEVKVSLTRLEYYRPLCLRFLVFILV